MVYLTTVSLSLLILSILCWLWIIVMQCSNFPSGCHFTLPLSLLLPPADFSILYIHCFVYTVYDDFSGQQSSPGDSGQNAAHHYTNNTATETDTGGFSTLYIQSCIQA